MGRLFESGQLGDAGDSSTLLLPVTVSVGAEATSEPADAHRERQTFTDGEIHIEQPGRAMVNAESDAGDVSHLHMTDLCPDFRARMMRIFDNGCFVYTASNRLQADISISDLPVRCN